MIAHPSRGVGNGAGWRPKLSYPWVAHGSGVCWLWNVLTGEEFQLRPGVRCEAAGWINPTTLIFYVGEANAEIWSLDITTRRETLIMGGVNISWGDASDGTWATSYAADGAVVINGQPVSLGVGRYIAASGSWVVVRTNTGLAVYRDSLRVSTVPWRGTCVYPSVDGAVAAYAYNGPVFVVDLTDGTLADASVTDPPAESSPAVCGEWLWTVSEHGGGRALGRPIGEKACLVLEADSPIDVAAQLVDDNWIVVTQAGAEPKTLTAQDIGADAPRVLLPKAPEPPKPPPPRVMLNLSATSGPVPLTVDATLVTLDGSGPVNAIRYRKDNVDDGGQDAPTHTFAFARPGTSPVYARAAGPGGVTDTPIQIITALPPLPVSAFTLGLCADWMQDEYFAHRVSVGVKAQRLGIGKDTAATQSIIERFQQYPQLTPLYIVRVGLGAQSTDELLRVPTRSMIEFGNESNIGDGPASTPKLTPQQYSTLAYAAEVLGHTVYWGCVSNLNKDGMDWLKEMLRLSPWMTHISIHDYDRDLTVARIPGLLNILGGRRFRVTETGVLCGPRGYKTPGGFLKGPKYIPITEEQQLDLLRGVVVRWRAVPTCDGVDVYQENSGATETTSFGLNDPAGKPRLAWQIFKEAV